MEAAVNSPRPATPSAPDPRLQRIANDIASLASASEALLAEGIDQPNISHVVEACRCMAAQIGMLADQASTILGHGQHVGGPLDWHAAFLVRAEEVEA